MARNRISNLEARINELEALKANSDTWDYDDELRLDELNEELRFAWADDEAEYNYALERQEFNPDGSLKYY